MNRLGNATSPYLQQHADNPVDWYEWGDEAFRAARERDVPILLSVGYATCHWCHVMAHESFEDAQTAAFMNEHFVNVKVDREQRPDVDAVYMRAVQAMTGAGGWPMTVFLAPDRRPFYAGTYFPPRDAYGMPSFRTVLASVANAWADRRDQLLGNADALTEHVRAMSAPKPAADGALPEDFAPRGLDNARRTFDARHGGFGSAPKFPAPTFLTYLLTQPDGRDMAVRTLDAMMRGGLMDQLGGGFHRYSVDERWLVPHFEKMLYDNAQLVRAYLRAHVVTGRADFLDTARATLAYMERELLTPEGGFACAQDADQEGIEGKFFVWTPQEFRDLLGADADLALRHYGVTDAGNFQDPHHPAFGRRSVLSVVTDVPELARAFSLGEDDVRARLGRARETLFSARRARAHPGLDDKVLTSWNGLALMAFADAYRLTGETHYLDVARRNADFVRARLTAPDGAPLHAYRADVRGLLEDAALYGLGLVALYAAAGNLEHLQWARALWDRARRDHWDDAAGVFYSSGPDAEALVAPTTETFDAAIMSDNAAACLLGLHIDRYFGEDEGARITARVLAGTANDMLTHPSGFGGLWQAHAHLHAPHVEIALLGTPEQRAPFERALAAQDLPFVTVAPAERGGGLPLLEGREGNGVAYVCRNFTCDLPARDPAAFTAQLRALQG